ncbi:MAG: class C sortase [Actinomycetaceae bacterium]|nr:class C sortase [Actinomycetaceae bacterium]
MNATHTSNASGRPRKGSRFSTLIPVILALAGITVLLYPVVATQLNNARQQYIAYKYSKTEKQLDPKGVRDQLAAADEYNRHGPTSPILDPWLARVAKDNNPYQRYLGQLNLTEAMGRLVIPAAKVDLPIYHGTSMKTLEKGIGHLYGSSLPVGGKSTHAVLTGHTGLSTASLLDHLTDIKHGDPIYIQVAGRKLKYKVFDIKVVKPDQVSSLKVQKGRDLVTVITCTPYGINSHRLLITGERVPMDKTPVFDHRTPLAWSWWMIAIIAVAALALGALGWWLYFLWKHHTKDENNKSGIDAPGDVSTQPDLGSRQSRQYPPPPPSNYETNQTIPPNSSPSYRRNQ